MNLGLSERLDHVLLNSPDERLLRPSPDVERPRAEERLIKQVLFIRVRRRLVFDRGLEIAVHVLPPAHGAVPAGRDFRERIDTRAGVLAALGVVGRTCEHGMRPERQAFAIAPVERRGRDAEPRRFAADLAQRSQRIEAVKGRILDPLRRYRPGQLLEAHDELAPFAPPAVIYYFWPFDPFGIAEQQERFDEVEDRRADRRVAAFGVADCPRDVAAILLADLLGFRPNVAAVDREAGDHLAQRVLQAVKREVARVAALLRNPVEPPRQHVQLARHRRLQYQLFAFISHVGEVALDAGQPTVEFAEGVGVLRIDEEAVEQVQKFVPGRPLRRPTFAQPLVVSQDLFDGDVKGAFDCGLRRGSRIEDRTDAAILDPRSSILDPRSPIGRGERRGDRTAQSFATAALQVAQVLFGIVESVNMIDGEAVDVALFYQAENQFVNRGEDLRLLDADGGQFVDVEEAAVIDLVRRHAPETQQVSLFGQQFFQTIEAARIAADAVEFLDCFFERDAHLSALGDERGKAALGDLFFAQSLANLFRIGLGARRQIRQGGDNAFEFGPVGMGFVERSLQFVERGVEYGDRSPRRDRQPGFVIVHEERAPLIGELDLLVFEHSTVLVAEYGQQRLVREILFRRAPVNVEERGVTRTRAVF